MHFRQIDYTMKTLVELIIYLNKNIIWGIPMVLFLFSVGLYLTFVTKGVLFLRFKTFLRLTLFSLFQKQNKTHIHQGTLTPFQSFCTALAATIGTGNIIGVALAIATGGPGAVFWLWISALVGMFIKYAEVTLAIAFRKKDSSGQFVGGPMYYIADGMHAKWLSFIFAILALLASFGIGASVQANAIASSLNNTFGISAVYSGFVVAILSGFVLIGGIKRIGNITERLVPFMSLLYIIGACIVIFSNYKGIPNAFSLIIKCAFTNTAATGGFIGASAISACRIGITRGVFTHEAGMGSSPIAHATANTDHPAHQGLWGAFEVFFDSIIVCTITALVILTSNVWLDEKYASQPNVMSTIAFEKAFQGGSYIVSIGLSLFAFASILAWYYYGETCLQYLFGNKHLFQKSYQLLYMIVTFLGAITSMEIIWEFSDLCNGLMSIPNLIAMIFLTSIIRKLTKDYFKDT